MNPDKNNFDPMIHLEQAKYHLSPELREVIHLQYDEWLTNDEAAERLGILPDEFAEMSEEAHEILRNCVPVIDISKATRETYEAYGLIPRKREDKK